MKRRTLITGLAAAGGAVATLRPSVRALAQSGAAGPVLRYGQGTAILTLDPVHGSFTGYPAGYEAALCLYDRLLDFDAQMRIVPELAASFTMAPDRRSASLRLRRGVLFHDGTPLDAAAVKVNLLRLMDPKRNPTNRPLWDPLAGIETSGADHVTIRLKAPFAELPNSLAHASSAIVSPAALAKYGDTGIAQHPVGAGPFRLASFSPGQQLVAEAFAQYWGGRPRTARIAFHYIPEAATRLNALETQAVDVIDSVPEALVGSLKGAPGVAVLTSLSLRPMGFAINLTRAKLRDPRVRQALNLAVPVTTIAQRVFFGYARAPDSPLAYATEGYHAVSPLAFDPAKAKALLAAAGYGSSKPLHLAMAASKGLFPADEAVAEVVANSLQQAGMQVAMTQIEAGSYWDVLRQDAAHMTWDIAMFGFNPSNASGLYQLASLFQANASDAGRPDVWNIGRYRNPTVDHLLAQAGAAPAAARRNALLAQAQAIIWHDNPYIWLQINENIVATGRKISGVEVLPVVFTSLRHATIA